MAFGDCDASSGSHRAAEAQHWRAIEAEANRVDASTSGGIDESARRMDAAAAITRSHRASRHYPPEKRSTLFMYAWSDLTPDQISQALQVPVGTVWSRLHRIRRKLSAPGSPAQLTSLAKEMENGSLTADA